MKKVHSKSRRNTPAKRSRIPGAPKPAAGSGAAQLSALADPPVLALRLGRLAFGQEHTGQRNGYHRLFFDVLAAQRLVLTERFSSLAEQTRNDDMGVTITSLSIAKLPSGLTWWEWDPRIAGRLPLQPGDLAWIAVEAGRVIEFKPFRFVVVQRLTAADAGIVFERAHGCLRGYRERLGTAACCYPSSFGRLIFPPLMQCDRALPPDSRHGRPAGRGGAAARARLKPGDLGRIPLEGIGWAIAGAESGPRARPMDLDWVRSIRDQCAAAGVLFMFKQRAADRRPSAAPAWGPCLDRSRGWSRDCVGRLGTGRLARGRRHLGGRMGPSVQRG